MEGQKGVKRQNAKAAELILFLLPLHLMLHRGHYKGHERVEKTLRGQKNGFPTTGYKRVVFLSLF